jgi:hypothetical protein
MAKTDDAFDRFGLEETAQAVINLTFALSELDFSIENHAYTGAIVTAILESTETFEDDGGGLLGADVAYDAAHKGESGNLQGSGVDDGGISENSMDATNECAGV